MSHEQIKRLNLTEIEARLERVEAALSENPDDKDLRDEHYALKNVQSRRILNG